MDLDLTEAIEAGYTAAMDKNCDCGFERGLGGGVCMRCPADAAVRAAAPIIERAVREEINNGTSLRVRG